MSKTKIDRKLEEIDKKLATHDFYIPQLVQDVKSLKSDYASLSENVRKLERKLKKT
jgi:peptidoglycan hydrolase CwlO-like protein